MDAASSAGILALGILTNAHDINILGTLIGQWTAHSRQQAHRPQIDILVKRLAHRQEQAPQRDVVRNPWIAYRTKQDAIEASSLKRGKSIGRHHSPLPQVALRPPVELLDIKMKAAIDHGNAHQGLHTLCNDLRPNTISGHDG